MPIDKTISILKSYLALKANKNKLTDKQYVRELLLINIELEEHLKNPNISDEQLAQINKLIKDGHTT